MGTSPSPIIGGNRKYRKKQQKPATKAKNEEHIRVPILIMQSGYVSKQVGTCKSTGTGPIRDKLIV